MLMTRMYVAALVAMGAVSFASPAVHAQANCQTYGKLALQQQKDNEGFKCGFSGPEWSSDLKAHIAWCGTVNPDQWKDELQRREQKLAACKSGKE